jgi:type IV secretory pathway VirB6-like protein
MGDPSRSASGRDRRLILLAMILAVGLAIGVYEYSDALTELAQSLTAGKLGRPQGRLHY